MIDLDERLVDTIKGLSVSFKDEPQPELLVRIPNRHPDIEYSVRIVTKEFTSLCPLNLAQPDYARIKIRYTPKEWCVELKSLKFYLVSFRQVAVFHEEVPTLILEALVKLLEPETLEVTGRFTTRGGLDTLVAAEYPSYEEDQVLE